jgi:hypothetical protein
MVCIKLSNTLIRTLSKFIFDKPRVPANVMDQSHQFCNHTVHPISTLFKRVTFKHAVCALSLYTKLANTPYTLSFFFPIHTKAFAFPALPALQAFLFQHSQHSKPFD